MNRHDRTWLFSSESVTEGHPDKICDQISDAVLDAILEQDAEARVACETVVTTGFVFVTGEVSTRAYVDLQQLVRDTVRDIGYDRAKYGFDADTCAVLTSIHEQSPDIAQGVNQALESREAAEGGRLSFVRQDAAVDLHTGAGDQGMMFGFACTETEDFMPLPISLAHALCRRLAESRKKRVLPLLRPDGKAQVTVEYRGYVPQRIHTIVLSTQHDPEYDQRALERDIMREVIRKVIPENLMDDKTLILINPTGRFVTGGPQGDSGLSGRKIIVDTYGGMAAHGGGSFSGKDPTKVDRSASYAARYVAKHLVAAGLAERIQIQLAYSIGVAKPVSVSIETYGTEKYAHADILKLIHGHFPLTPDGIIRQLDLRRPIYKKTASYGHFGRRDLDLPWERLDRLAALQADVAANYSPLEKNEDGP